MCGNWGELAGTHTYVLRPMLTHITASELALGALSIQEEDRAVGIYGWACRWRRSRLLGCLGPVFLPGSSMRGAAQLLGRPMSTVVWT